jgi:CheY-like chemotaxis protein
VPAQLLHVRLLGEFSATDHRGNSLSIGNRKTQALIIYLALKIAARPSVREIADLICGGGPDGDMRARSLIRDLQYAMRYLPPGILVETPDGIRFNRDVVEVDAQRFADLVSSPSINALSNAAELYRGNLLEGFTTGIPAFDDWITEKRLSLWRGAVIIFSRLLAAQVRAGWWESAVESAGRLLTLDPTQEIVHRTLMRLQLEQGRPDSALRRYQECADILQREFGRAPSEETERVHDEIRAALKRAPAPREAFHPGSSGPMLVLVVEDDLVSAALIEGFLNETGLDVVIVGDGADALMEIARRTFDLLIIDINIPTLNGLRLFEIMIQKGIDTPAVFVTGTAGADVEAQSLEAGAADFLRKPIRKEVLIPRVRQILQRHTKSHAQLASE